MLSRIEFEKMRIIKIGALWCPACLIVNKALKKVDVEVVNYDYDLDEEEVKKYHVGKVLPVLIFESEGKEITRLIGEVSLSEILDVIEGVNNETN